MVALERMKHVARMASASAWLFGGVESAVLRPEMARLRCMSADVVRGEVEQTLRCAAEIESIACRRKEYFYDLSVFLVEGWSGGDLLSGESGDVSHPDAVVSEWEVWVGSCDEVMEEPHV